MYHYPMLHQFMMTSLLGNVFCITGLFLWEPTDNPKTHSPPTLEIQGFYCSWLDQAVKQTVQLSVMSDTVWLVENGWPQDIYCKILAENEKKWPTLSTRDFYFIFLYQMYCLICIQTPKTNKLPRVELTTSHHWFTYWSGEIQQTSQNFY